MDDSILERHGAKGPEVLFRDELAACRAAGDAFGVHLHLYRRCQDGTWLNDLQDDAWIVANLRAALGRFEAWNGGPCRHFSVGDNLLTPAIQDALEQAGVWYDCTAIPDYDATATMTAREGPSALCPELCPRAPCESVAAAARSSRSLRMAYRR